MRNNLICLQVMRGIAAISVAAYHTLIITKEKGAYQSTHLDSIVINGFLGVHYFFILSGFIILFSHFDDIGKPAAVLRYFKKRFYRVFPIYWILLTMYIIASALGVGEPDFSWSPTNLINAYLLLPPSELATLPLQVAWTLMHEVLFYIAFGIIIFNLRLGVFIFAIWFFVILTVQTGDTHFSRISLVWNLYFFQGMFLYYLVVKRFRIISPAICFFYSALIFSLFFETSSGGISSFAQRPLWYHALIGSAFTSLILGTILVELKHGCKIPKLLTFFGDASYSIYLVHSAVISLIIILLPKIGIYWEYNEVLFILIFSISIFCGGLCYVFIERPVVSYCKRFI